MARKKIGVLIVTIDSFFQDQLWLGMEEEAKQLGYDLLFFCGSSLDGGDTDLVHLNVIYDLVNVNALDGLIISAGALGNYCGKTKLKSFIDRYNQVPIVSIAVDIPEYHSVLMSNKESMKNIVNHLVEVHHYQKIAYISGPLTNNESLERLEGYKQALGFQGMPVDESYIVIGDFSKKSGLDAAYELLEVRGIQPDAIVAANDDMAAGAFVAINRMGYIVGEDIGLTGFDDTEQSQTLTQPLTSVKQPLFEMGIASVAFFKSIFEGHDEKHSQSLIGSNVIRQSCGCLKMYEQETIIKVDSPGDTYNHTDQSEQISQIIQWFDKQSDKIIEDMIERLDPTESTIASRNKLFRLLDAFKEDLMDAKLEGHFLNLLNYYVSKDMETSQQDSNWQDALYAFYLYLSECHLPNNILAMANKMIYYGNTLVGRIFKRSEKSVAYQLRSIYYEASYLVQKFQRVVNMRDLGEMLDEQVKYHQIETLIICGFPKPLLLDKDRQTLYPKEVDVLFGWNAPFKIEEKRFETNRMIPDSVFDKIKNRFYAFYPLVFQKKQFGYIITDTQSAQQLIFRTFKEQIENVLERIYWYERVEAYNRQLEYMSLKDSLTGLNNRHGFFEKARIQYDLAVNSDSSFTIIYGDMDGLKKINDSYGHQEGDRAIILLGRGLSVIFEGCDNIARLGGDEFIIACGGDTSETEINKLLEQLTHLLDKWQIDFDLPYKLSLSVGIQCYDKNAPKGLEELMNLADQKLYMTKKSKK